MDVAVIIERNDANPFTIIINHFDSVPEIKKKIQKKKGIPISQQTLIFEGEILTNDYDILRSNIDNKSRIQLIVNKEFPAPSNHPLKKIENGFSPPPTPPAEDYLVKVAKNETRLDFDKEFKLVKEMAELYRFMTMEKEFPPVTIHPADHDIAENEPFEFDLPSTSGSEPETPTFSTPPRSPLQDDKVTSLRKFPEPPPAAVMTKTENDSPPPETAVKIGLDVFERKRRPESEKEGPLRVVVVFDGERTQVLVNKEQSVWSLREKLDQLELAGLFEYPGYPFYFFHRLDVMKDDKSFEWHRVDQGDEIYIISVY